ncbi:hypothetical protein J3P71_29490 (plasmid) [Rhizobium leguminosarum]|nr:hypothetical protein [Rhizobium leguminosarum]QSZ11837.1 hypothetical protein J3P71_29490 [Rhizobium leguminosarum]
MTSSPVPSIRPGRLIDKQIGLMLDLTKLTYRDTDILVGDKLNCFRSDVLSDASYKRKPAWFPMQAIYSTPSIPAAPAPC